ncbi:acetoin dehydrogenase dihydrolipoyllysine-residue acetyltransferase subunit [Labrys monachus]|uniref:Pyruvate dehydrogenase E2 component (Dihydrolipoamide acetyltransferase) n=1 Tax=Labrys monachus TaxID=217067 RepID=A0ABU0FL69_9HYPH|nr:acetoin dehydrogenase dihydrolipoyllysine-residue acetyltransferase subunit [Labrys monachus]MDQ0395330.1 pyruvate dehydrogenase E2 component (dihydrolipoamide acetyltransferase) [Labrys monachus]
MASILALPRLGETMEEGRVAGWLKKPGDAFKRGETIVEIETDKTVVELPALSDGVLVEILAAEGAQINVGEPLCRYEGGTGEAEAAAPAPPAATPVSPVVAPAAPPVPPAAVAAAAGRSRATPLARRLARQNGIDIETVSGTGRRSRIQAHDVERLVAATGRPAPADDPRIRFCAVPAGRIAYRTWNEAGAGAPVLLLHGFGGDSQTWAVLAALLARQGRRVVAPDLPGHGATDFEEAGLDGLTDAVAAFLDALPLADAELVGHSLGGAVAMRLAARLGARLGRVTLIAPAGLGSAIDADFIDGMAHAATGGGLAHLLRRVALRPPVLSAAQLDAMAASLGGGRLHALAAALVRDGRQQVDIVADLAASQGKARLVWGLEDRIIPWIQATAAGSATPVHFISEAGHMPQWDQPQRLAALIA